MINPYRLSLQPALESIGGFTGIVQKAGQLPPFSRAKNRSENLRQIGNMHEMLFKRLPIVLVFRFR
jgi:hypothetical protein